MDNEQISRILKTIAVFLIILAVLVVLYFVITFIAAVPSEWEPRTPEIIGD
ncbi:MAG: hypothetical protein PWR20_2518 [Bacteroidales bacterium]|jgi:uncharacterized protein involved in cysteine biosynthesis|nr:hypothetical protein [Bacteroidales bacterium]MDN5328743.1 hypothetical protein [Bacteroidales bacterium]NPV36383.1 hypothetical protein [Bacteroidales bacterium]